MLMPHRRKGAARELDRDRLTWCPSKRAAESACRRGAARRLHRRRRRRAEETAEPVPPSGLDDAQLRFRAPLLNKAAAICSGVPLMTTNSSISSCVGPWFWSSDLLQASILALGLVISEALSLLRDPTATPPQHKNGCHTSTCVKCELYMLNVGHGPCRKSETGCPLQGHPPSAQRWSTPSPCGAEQLGGLHLVGGWRTDNTNTPSAHRRRRSRRCLRPLSGALPRARRDRLRRSGDP